MLKCSAIRPPALIVIALRAIATRAIAAGGLAVNT